MISPDFYQVRAKHFACETKRTEAIIKRYGWMRLALVLLTAVCLYGAFSQPALFFTLPVLIGGFIVLVRLQIKQEDQKLQLHYLHILNQQEEKGLRFESTSFPNGQQFADPHHPYSHDLDLFGTQSVFQYINRCATGLGEQRLAHDLMLLDQPLITASLLERQEAVNELSKRIDFRQHVWAAGRQITDISFNHAALNAWLKDKSFITNNVLITIVRWALPLITIIVLGFAFYDITHFPWVFGLMVVQLSIVRGFSKKIKIVEQQLSHGKKALGNYARIFELLSKERVQSSLMKRHHAQATQAFENMKQVSSLVNAFEARQNAIAMLFGNGLFLFDLQSISKLEAWRSKHGAQLPGWLDSLAEWDALLSPAALRFNYPEYAFAKPVSENVLHTSETGHLLIPVNERITNSIMLGEPATVWLITGANMAGKSTFLRTLGVNFVLGSIGSPVCASSFSMPLVALRTGMRTTDSLQEHQSYFFAELNRLQSIMEELRSGKPMLILLDEILKGTNSTDKQAGSRELLKQLKDANVLVMLATHDIALGDLEQAYPAQIANACFEGQITNDELTFDYKLHPGIAQKANATFLMRKMGIIPTG